MERFVSVGDLPDCLLYRASMSLRFRKNCNINKHGFRVATDSQRIPPPEPGLQNCPQEKAPTPIVPPPPRPKQAITKNLQMHRKKTTRRARRPLVFLQCRLKNALVECNSGHLVRCPQTNRPGSKSSRDNPRRPYRAARARAAT